MPLEPLQLGRERPLVGLGPLGLGLGGAGDAVQLGVDQPAHVLHLRAGGGDERVALAEIGAQVRLLGGQLGILAAQAVDRRGLDRLRRRAGSDRLTPRVADALQPGLGLGGPRPGRHQPCVQVRELLLVHEAAAGRDQAVLRLVVLQLLVGAADRRAQIRRGGPAGRPAARLAASERASVWSAR